jgi:hypothetical protein
MHPMKLTLSVLVTGALAATLAATMPAAPASAKPLSILTPGNLTRGADVTVAHLDGKTVVDGSVRVRIKAPTVRLLGKSGSDYVVATADRQGAHGRILRVEADGTTTRLARADVFETILSGDGATVVGTKVDRSLRTTVTAYDATTGAQLGQRSFKGFSSVLDAEGDQVLMGSGTRALVWETGTDTVEKISDDAGYIGDLSADVVGTFTKDPYEGGCSVVRRISTGERLLRSCTERVTAFNADATRVATIALLSDGPGPGRVHARTIDGKALGRYQVRSGWFGEIRFETPAALLLDVNGPRKAFTARCTGTDCERASALKPAQSV